MPYAKKAAAPFVINLGVEMAAAIAGTESAWLGGYIPVLGADYEDVTRMCAAGPPSDATWTVQDSLLAASGVGMLALVGKLRRIAIAQVFPQFCELVGTPAAFCTVYGQRSARVVTNNYWYFEAFPTGGFTGNRIRVVSDNGRPGEVAAEVFAYDAANTNLGSFGGFSGKSAGFVSDYAAMPATTTHFSVHGPDFGATLELQFCTVETAPARPAQPIPANVIAPPGTTGSTDIAGLARDLAALQLQLQTIQGQLHDTSTELLVPGVRDNATTTTPAADQIVDLVGAQGIAIFVTGIPASWGWEPGDPTRHFRIGRYTLGYADGWGHSVDLEHDSTVVEPLPKGVTRVGVHVWSPATATVVTLKLPPPP